MVRVLRLVSLVSMFNVCFEDGLYHLMKAGLVVLLRTLGASKLVGAVVVS